MELRLKVIDKEDHYLIDKTKYQGRLIQFKHPNVCFPPVYLLCSFLRESVDRRIILDQQTEKIP